MRKTLTCTVALVPVAAAGFVLASAGSADAPGTPVFSNPGQIDNRYLPLAAHRRCDFRGEGKDGTKTRSVLARLTSTRRFTVGAQTVDATIVSDKAYEDGKHVETALDYFAQADDGTVYYLGEHVDNIRNGKVVDHSGTWLYGKDTDVLGVAMLPHPAIDERYRLEDVPGITTESDRVEETGARAKAGRTLYTDVIRTSEFIQPEGEVEYKLYAPGVGTIVEYDPEGRSELVGCR